MRKSEFSKEQIIGFLKPAEACVTKCHLSRLRGEHKRKRKIVDVAGETGLHRNTVTLLYNETAARVDMEAIDKLYEFFGVEVGAARAGAGHKWAAMRACLLASVREH